MKPKIGIIGKGAVGSALRRGLERVGYEVKNVGHYLKGVQETAAWGEILVLAVPFAALDDTLAEIGDQANGKTLIDVTNAVTPDGRLALGCTTSGAEALQKKAPGASVIKAFNTVFAEHMYTGRLLDEPITLFAAGDDGEAKATVLRMGREIGFDPVDAGPLENARWLETLGYFHVQLGYTLKMGPEVEFRLLRAESL